MFAVLAFVVMSRTGLHPHEVPSINVDADWLYRRLLPNIARRIYNTLHQLHIRFRDSAISSLKGFTQLLAASYLGRLHLATSWPTGSMVLWIAVILGFFLIADILDH
jgi:multicomponent Na+:H+ antiporter subunit D